MVNAIVCYILLMMKKAEYFYEVWKNNSVDDVVTAVLHNQELWGVDLSHFYDLQRV
jgi:hypothetical protein